VRIEYRGIKAVRIALHLVWLTGLVAPAALAVSMATDRTLSPLSVAAATFVELGVLRLVLPQALFFSFTWPLLAFGCARVAAQSARGVNLVDLVLQWRSFTGQEITDAVGPYAVAIACLLALTGLLCLACCGCASRDLPSRTRCLLGLFVSLLFFKLTPLVVIGRAWPSDLLLATAAAADPSRGLQFDLYPNEAVGTSPRRLHVKWQAADRRPAAAAAAAAATVVLVIGESVRSDALKECGGLPLVRAVAADALVACDVTAGADSTFHSVPLLISRDWPGHARRVAEDTTFQHALAEVGFESYWLSVQTQLVAWSDALHQFYDEGRRDEELMPHLALALRADHPRKSIVLHAYNAHWPYCRRYDPDRAPYGVDCGRLGNVPDAATVAAHKLAYTNAVDESMRFLNGVIDALRDAPGEVFLVFTSDHGENFRDDRRRLVSHELAHPTVWDIRVPAVFWANEAWKQTHAREWETLRAQAGKPLMHADIVPTLMAAADVAYEDGRRGRAINLLEARVPARRRAVQVSLGVETTWETLVDEVR
jgi:glucan phosphoethanolaminetransferase (alkaline phosphatase superfamily)